MYRWVYRGYAARAGGASNQMTAGDTPRPFMQQWSTCTTFKETSRGTCFLMKDVKKMYNEGCTDGCKTQNVAQEVELLNQLTD
jgi:hypothetical protein